MSSRSSDLAWVFPAGIILLGLFFIIAKVFDSMAHSLGLGSGDLLSAFTSFAMMFALNTLFAAKGFFVEKFKQWLGVSLYCAWLMVMFLLVCHADWLCAHTVPPITTPWFASWWFETIGIAAGGFSVWFFCWHKT